MALNFGKSADSVISQSLFDSRFAMAFEEEFDSSIRMSSSRVSVRITWCMLLKI